MSILGDVRRALEENPDIVVYVREGEYNPEAGVSHYVRFFIAPRNPLYNGYKLEKFMDTLDFGGHGYGENRSNPYRSLGAFCSGGFSFDETIGEETVKTIREVAMTDDEARRLPGFVDGKKIIAEEKRAEKTRRIFVHVYPSEAIASDAADGKIDLSRIPEEELERYRLKTA